MQEDHDDLASKLKDQASTDAINSECSLCSLCSLRTPPPPADRLRCMHREVHPNGCCMERKKQASNTLASDHSILVGRHSRYPQRHTQMHTHATHIHTCVQFHAIHIHRRMHLHAENMHTCIHLHAIHTRYTRAYTYMQYTYTRAQARKRTQTLMSTQTPPQL